MSLPCKLGTLGLLVLLGCSVPKTTYSPIFCRSPPRPVYSVRQPLNTEAYLRGGGQQDSAFSTAVVPFSRPLWLPLLGALYPLVSRMMSPGWIRLPTSSHTEMLMLPVLSATLQVRTSCPSFVLVTRPLREEITWEWKESHTRVVVVRLWVSAA